MRLLLALLSLTPLPALAQVTPVAPIEKGTGLPPPGAEEAQVLAPIHALFAALEKGDAAGVLAQVYPEGRVTAVGDGAVRQQSFAQYATRVTPDRPVRERITGPAIDIDGDVAMVWAPFTLSIGGAVQSCGTNLFDLVRENGRWKIMNVTYSHRTGCAAQ